MSQKVVLFITTAVRTSNPTLKSMFRKYNEKVHTGLIWLRIWTSGGLL
jgi:hypothetical protein